jgi:hypothetical protein
MDGHVHIGVGHFIVFGAQVVLALLLFRLLAVVLANSNIPLLEKSGTALAWIVG